MNELGLHEFHRGLNAEFGVLNGSEMVASYGDVAAEYKALRESAGIIDLSFRSRICLTGADRIRFLHGQVTNDIKRLQPGHGCYAVLVTAKGKMQSDLNILCLQDELLLDFEPGLTAAVTERLEKYIVADDVQVVAVAPHYGLLSVQGPRAAETVRGLQLFPDIPAAPLQSLKVVDPTLGEIHLVHHVRLGISGFDLYVPTAAMGAVADKVIASARSLGGQASGWSAFERLRIEMGIPRFGLDMDESNIPLECGIESRAVSYSKGCYIGQEVINRIHTIGHVNRELRGLKLAQGAIDIPARGDKLFHGGKEVGRVTSAILSERLNGVIALSYVRREANQVGTELELVTSAGKQIAKIVELPF